MSEVHLEVAESTTRSWAQEEAYQKGRQDALDEVQREVERVISSHHSQRGMVAGSGNWLPRGEVLAILDRLREPRP